MAKKQEGNTGSFWRAGHMGSISARKWWKKNLLFLFPLKKPMLNRGTITMPISCLLSLKQLPPALLSIAVLFQPCWSEVTGRAAFTGLHLQLAVMSALVWIIWTYAKSELVNWKYVVSNSWTEEQAEFRLLFAISSLLSPCALMLFCILSFHWSH